MTAIFSKVSASEFAELMKDGGPDVHVGDEVKLVFNKPGSDEATGYIEGVVTEIDTSRVPHALHIQQPGQDRVSVAPLVAANMTYKYIRRLVH